MDSRSQFERSEISQAFATRRFEKKMADYYRKALAEVLPDPEVSTVAPVDVQTTIFDFVSGEPAAA
jgi:hypothetical protein